MCKLGYCTNSDFFQRQSITIRRCIEEDKWYLSEKAGHDVGWDAAEQHFFNTYFMGFAAGFRASYCGLACPHRHECREGRKYTVDKEPKEQAA